MHLANSGIFRLEKTIGPQEKVGASAFNTEENYFVPLITELTTDSGKSFHEVNFLMMLISNSNLSVEKIREARATRLLIYEIRYVQGTKFVKLTYRLVFVSF